MTELLVDPQIVTTVAADIDGIGSTIKAATAAAAAPTSGVLAAAADEVSAAIANLFGAHGQEFQAVVNQVEAYQTQFQQTLTAAANAYVQTETAAVAALQGALAAPPPQRRRRQRPRFRPSMPLIPSCTSARPACRFLRRQYATVANNLYVRAVGRDIRHPLHARRAVSDNWRQEPDPESIGIRGSHDSRKLRSAQLPNPAIRSPYSATRRAQSSPRCICSSWRPWVIRFRRPISTSCWSATR